MISFINKMKKKNYTKIEIVQIIENFKKNIREIGDESCDKVIASLDFLIKKF